MLKMPRSRKPILPKPVFKTLVWVSILLILVVGGGAVYIWYMGKNAKFVESANIELPVRKSNELLKPTQPASNSAIGVSVQSLTSPILPGSEAAITIHTRGEARCTIKAEYNKVASKDPALVEKVADEYGTLGWSWYVEETVPEGKWPVEVNCFYGDKSAMVRGDLVVGKEKEN